MIRTFAALVVIFLASPAMALVPCKIQPYALEATLTASAVKDCTIGYAIDTDTFYIRANGSWTALSTLVEMTGANGGTFVNDTDNMWDLAENSEDLRFNFGTGNSLTLSSSTGVDDLTTAFDLVLSGGAGVLTLTDSASSIVLNDDDDTALVIGAAGDLNIITVDTQDAGTSVTISTTTGQTGFKVSSGTSLFTEAVGFSAGAGAINFTSSAATALFNDNDATAFAFGSTDQTNLLVLDTTNDAETVVVNGTTATTALHVDVGESVFDEGIDAPIVSTVHYQIRFCGNGPNGATAQYMGPVLLDDTEADLAYGGAGCDALDNATEATADAPWHAGFAFKPLAMACVATCTAAGGANDAITFQLRDDTSSVSGMSCATSALGGDGVPSQCSVRDASPATVAANSAIAVSITGTDDDCRDAGDDFECVLTVTF